MWRRFRVPKDRGTPTAGHTGLDDQKFGTDGSEAKIIIRATAHPQCFCLSTKLGRGPKIEDIANHDMFMVKRHSGQRQDTSTTYRRQRPISVASLQSPPSPRSMASATRMWPGTPLEREKEGVEQGGTKIHCLSRRSAVVFDICSSA
jgi:hypothetical protein